MTVMQPVTPVMVHLQFNYTSCGWYKCCLYEMMPMHVAQALSEIHAAGVCLLNISADSIWISQSGTATFVDFSMAHEFVPGKSSVPLA